MGVPEKQDVHQENRADCELELSRFRRTFRRRLLALARSDPALSDLIVAFPAAAIVIVTDYGPKVHRHDAVDLVKRGQPLKLVAKALRLPFWMRKLPPEAFSGNLPNRLPDDPQLGARLAGLIPDSKVHVSGWFKGVTAAWVTAGPEFAHWVACHPRLVPANVSMDGVETLGLFAWASADQGPASQLMPGRWNPKVSPPRACANLGAWVRRVRRDLVMGQNGLTDPWLTSGRAGGFRFVALASVADLRSEAEAMNHCALDYAEHLIAGQCRLFAVRRGAQRVATMEIRPHRYHDRIPEIVQLYGKNNELVPDRVWQAAFQWLGEQKSYDLPIEPEESAAQPDLATWRQFWRPYWRAVGPHRLLPEVPDRAALQRLVRAGEEMSRRAGH